MSTELQLVLCLNLVGKTILIWNTMKTNLSHKKGNQVVRCWQMWDPSQSQPPSRPSSWRCRFNAGSSRVASRGRDACSRASICLSLDICIQCWCSVMFGILQVPVWHTPGTLIDRQTVRPPEDFVFILSICTWSNYRTSFLPFHPRVWFHTQWVASGWVGRRKSPPITGHWSSPRPSLNLLDTLDTEMGRWMLFFSFLFPLSSYFAWFSEILVGFLKRKLFWG